MSDEVMDASAESSTATVDTAQAETSAGTQNTVAPAQPVYKGFHEHPDWQRMVQKTRTYEQQNGQLSQTIQQLQGRLRELEQAREASGRPQPSQDEIAAAQALERLISLNPKLSGLLGAPQQLGNLQSLQDRLDRMEKSQQQSITQAGQKVIGDFIDTIGLPKEASAKLEKAVVGFISGDPQMRERFVSGDTSVITEVLNDINESLLAAGRRSATAAVVQTKQAAQKLPPALRAGAPSGPSAPPKPTRESLREKMRGLLMGDATE